MNFLPPLPAKPFRGLTVNDLLGPEVLDYFRQQGAKGGKLSRDTSTAAQRKARATKASKAAALARTKKKQAKG